MKGMLAHWARFDISKDVVIDVAAACTGNPNAIDHKGFQTLVTKLTEAGVYRRPPVLQIEPSLKTLECVNHLQPLSLSLSLSLALSLSLFLSLCTSSEGLVHVYTYSISLPIAQSYIRAYLTTITHMTMEATFTRTKH